MRRTDFDYHLPAELIAQRPPTRRGASRLLHLPAVGAEADRAFADLPGLLRPGDLLVLNNTRVLPARVHGRKASGGRLELLVERVTGACELVGLLRCSRSPRPGARLEFGSDDEAVGATVVDRVEEDFFHLQFDRPVADWLERLGHTPLPTYIDRADEPQDAERYQTVYARHPGAVAAPTAGLHFDADMLQRLERQGIHRAEVTLHVGAGTFQPVRAERIDEHRMHAEWMAVSEQTCAAVERTRRDGGRVVAVGTTAVRALESAAAEGRLAPFSGETRLYVTPGYRFRVVDCMLTNFHAPESTLLMLISAFAGYERVMAAYRHAVAQRYRFLSYGDAMFIERQDNPA